MQEMHQPLGQASDWHPSKQCLVQIPNKFKPFAYVILASHGSIPDCVAPRRMFAALTVTCMLVNWPGIWFNLQDYFEVLAYGYGLINFTLTTKVARLVVMRVMCLRS
ncbi:hypothetical protein VNO77_30943 [Canavalia gladiata]|uniref:Uncharacterized protein n=1 Tax=Canavalia gladiata TaxID=3824 RepID=A0AAN9KPA9_CANGL